MRKSPKFLSKRMMAAFWAGVLFTIGPWGLFGCTLTSGAHRVEGYQTQKRIVWQGTLTVDHGADIVRLIYFGYDRNGDLKRLTDRAVCRGVDVLEYKHVLPDGRWDYKPFMIIVDDNFDCIAERALYDCDGDGVFEKVADLTGQGVLLEFVNPSHVALLKTACRGFRRRR